MQIYIPMSGLILCCLSLYLTWLMEKIRLYFDKITTIFFLIMLRPFSYANDLKLGMGMTFFMIFLIFTYLFPGWKAGEGTLEATSYVLFESSLTLSTKANLIVCTVQKLVRR